MNLKKMSTASLYKELRNAVTQTASGLKLMAEIWQELKDRGEDLSQYYSPLLNFLPEVASGKLLPEMLLLYGGRETSFMSHIATLLPEEQAKLALGDGRVPVLHRLGEAPKIEMLGRLSLAKLRQVIGDGVVRTPTQQRQHLPPARSHAVWLRPAPPVIDPRIEDFMTLSQWQAVCDAAKKAGVEPYRQIVTWLVRGKYIPAAERSTRSKTTRTTQDHSPA